MSGNAMDRLRSPDLKRLLQPDLPVPLYYQMFTILRDYILSGELPVDSRLPTEIDLTHSFGVSRMTAKRALDDLAAAGLVKRWRGRGTLVTHQSASKPLRAPLTGLLENLEVLAEGTEVKLLQFARTVPPPAVRALFNLGADEAMVHAIRLRSRNKVPFAYYTSWTNTDHPQFNKANLATTSRLVLFKRCRIPMARIDQTLSAVSADAVSAGYLKVKPGAALLTLERQSFDAAGQLVDLLNIQYRPDQFRYRMSLDIENWKPKG
ncbi:MAG TPA: GntR family transcriptional regulator [Rhodanobacter sp.]